ncbi:MAG: DEAD/DEAH box helicase [Oscillospiraceae bacterium]|nr:DEAD/DEAH box helicase [Oscillospiraceae bacterium]
MEFTQGVRFDSFRLSQPTMRAIRNKGYEISTPVQAGCIGPMMEGKDVIAKAPTGTGKTMAFGIPIIEKIDPESEAVQAVILAPTRELAMQITDEMRDIAVYHEGVRLVCLYGGQPIGKQINALKRKPQIVVATPGRLSDHMKRRTVTLGAVKTVVLDEADRMLDMGFIHDVTRILDKIPNRQNLGMFSATISREVMDISWVYQRDPEEITVQATKENKPDILQYRLEVDAEKKVETIARILEGEALERVIVFCNTKGSTERLSKFLELRGIDVACIHGDIPQKKREAVMAKFRAGELRVFVATDVASRGIDVDDVDAVFNYEVPEENEYYIHRIGRTGRAKRHGVAYTLLSDFPSRMRLDDIARNTKNQILVGKLTEDGRVVPAEEKK